MFIIPNENMLHTCLYNYYVDSQTLENMSDEGLSLSNSNATSEPNMSKNRYENILPCENNVKILFMPKVISYDMNHTYTCQVVLNY